MNGPGRRHLLPRLGVAALLALAAAAGLSAGAAGANPEPAAPSAPEHETPSQPAPGGEAPAPQPRAPAGEPFLPPGEWTETPPAGATESPSPSAEVPGAPADSSTPTEIDSSPVAASGSSSTSGTSRAAGGAVALAGVGAAAAGGWFGRRPDETKDEYGRRMAGGAVWTLAGGAILVAKGITVATVFAGGGCFVIAGVILWWGAPGRVRSQPAPAGPTMDLQKSLDAARDHNLELNRTGVKTQSQQTANPVDDQ